MRIGDYSQRVTADQLDAALRAGGFDGVSHYMAGTLGFALRIEDPAIVAEIRGKGWPQLGIDIPFSPSNVDGEATATRVAQVYGFGPGLGIGLDIEPVRFVLDPAAWAAASDRWCDQVRAAGFSPGVYGTDPTVAACANRADWIWRARPGECDPAGPGLASAFFAGRRIIQCGSGAWSGVEFDVNYSQFAVGGDVLTQDDLNAIRAALKPDFNSIFEMLMQGSDAEGGQPAQHDSILLPIYQAMQGLTPAAIASAVVQALPPTETGGLTEAQVQQAVTAALSNLVLRAS